LTSEVEAIKEVHTMIRGLDGKTPKIASSAFISEAAYVIGDVEIGQEATVWPGAVIRGDFGLIRIGYATAVEDNAVIHSGSPSAPIGDVTIGIGVIIGHGAVLNCRSIGDHVLIGMNATILHDAEIGGNCVVAAGCVVGHDMKIPANSFVAGVPGRILGQPSEEQLWWAKHGHKEYLKLAALYRKEGL
jgi:carbonic anhydrase/acetyltransferase-like protein (isoleucine patch superfamily)